jgi:uncharacterized ion transporter superfamily protein YfcC
VQATSRRFPDSLVLIFGMIVLAQLATWVLPAGSYEFALDEAGNATRRVLAGTYHTVEAKPLPWHAFLTSIPKGLEKSADIIFFVFIVGGAIGVLRATGAIDALLGSAIQRLGHRPAWLVVGMLTLLAVGSSTIGMAEEYMPFVPILVTMCLALRFDAVVALGIIYAAAAIGYGCAALNPFTVLIAQDIAGLPAGSGQAFRWVFLALCIPVCAQHILAYARRIERDPARSLVHDVDYSSGFEMPADVALSARRALLLALGAAAIGLFVWGSKHEGWYLTELAGLFLGMTLLCGVVAPLSPNRVAAEFCKGAGELATTALLIGFARTIEVLLVDGAVIHTVVHGVAQPLEALGAEGAALGMLAVQSATNFLIPSGSGQAYVTMPIMAPLSDITGVPRHTAVLAYQIGDGFMNLIVPTNALLMGMLGLARIPYERWVRFVVPLLAKLFAVAAVAVLVAQRWGDRLGL